ncbi:hypothetical protein SeMB42_g04281 [Synchytrium endobioticum]|uniref:Galactose oxidase-like Early set domain-containing protein n=1 Tax=Synchytrium endobioticum TaxID=286115 RepID=A0A507CZL0_9FUNG|nr:hypothetical protein SeLEV6574_g06253 [Synchytrium endobioticum]TPX44613.1 hypothetical protein SeMB42_g04281 [Synchytrium endobioticum]
MVYQSRIALFLLPLLLATQTVNGEYSGSWNIVGNSSNVCIILALLPGNRLLCAERPHVTPYVRNKFAFDPLSGNGELTSEIDLNVFPLKSTLTHIPTSPFCGGPVQMADGSVVVAGGDFSTINNAYTNAIYVGDGVKTVRRYHASCDSPTGGPPCPVGYWEPMYEMTVGRWYPTSVALPDGSAMIVGGVSTNLDMHFLNASINTPSFEYTDRRGPPIDLRILNTTFPFNTFPASFLLPSGKVFVQSGTDSALIDPATNSIDYSSIPRLDPETSRPKIYPYTPTTVVLPMTLANNWSFTLMICGGTKRSSRSAPLPVPDDNDLYANDECYTIQPDNANQQWQKVDPLPIARVMPDAVLMPDGKVAYVNGGNYGYAGGSAGFGVARFPVHEVDIFDPTAPNGKRWTRGPNATVDRLYHSTAVLMPDGRVITAGSEEQNWADIYTFGITKIDNDGQMFTNCTYYVNCTDPFEHRVEAYSPPYLDPKYTSNVPAPIISSAPHTVTHGSSFYIGLSTNPFDVDMVSLIRYSSVTHSTNTDQRFIELRILSRNGTHIQVQVPSNPNLAPPGNWMLFCLSRGRPGVAATVLLKSGLPNLVSALQYSGSIRMAGVTISSISLVIVYVLVTLWMDCLI